MQTGIEAWIAKALAWRAFRWIGRFSMKLSGIEFFTSRSEMRPFDDLLSTAKNIDVIAVIGRTLHEHELTHIKNINRVILPHPECESIKHYAKTVGELGHLQRNIAEATTSLYSKRIEVKWYPHAIHHAILLVDTERNSGWVQLESVLPFSIPDSRGNKEPGTEAGLGRVCLLSFICLVLA